MQPVKIEGFPAESKTVTPATITVPMTENAYTGCNATFGSRAANLIWVGTSGDVVIIGSDLRTTHTLKSAIAGQWHKMPPFVNVQATSTAVDIVAGIAFDMGVY